METMKRSGPTSMIALCLLLVLPQLWAQTTKELVADACNNERHQRQQKALWASHVERRARGHVYREEEIETLEGPVRRLLAVDGHEPSSAERKQDDDRLRNLMQNPKARLTLKKNRETDEKKFDDLLRVIQDAFLFEDEGRQGGLEKLAFRPNPGYSPVTYEETVLHAMSGVILIDLQDKRLAHISGTLTHEVSFGYGLIGHVNKGGTIEMNRTRLSSGRWKTSSSKINLDGRFVFFKTINKQLDETRGDFEPVAPDMSIQRAVEQVSRK
jgi:hypothetical protein